MMGFGFGMGGLGLIFMVLFWVGLIVLAIWLVGLLFPSTKKQVNSGDERSPSAQEILKTRYAQGELTSEQYQEMLQTLQE
jgi:putative membrane protein